jgi:predicted site-specific integrase-resolvase
MSNSDDELLGTRRAAEFLGIAESTLRDYRYRGYIRADVVMDGKPFHRRGELRRWLLSRPGQGARTDLKPGA